MKARTIILATAAALAPLSASAQLLTFPPNANRTAEQVEALSSYRMPTGPWTGDGLKFVRTEGEVIRQAWQFRAKGETTLQLLEPLRQQLLDANFDILYECDANACGGFDFRYATDVLSEPAMHVDLGNYRYISARRTDGASPEYVSLLISRSADRCFVQVIQVGSAQAAEPTMFSASSKSPDPELGVGAADVLNAPLGDLLVNQGHAVLADLTFKTGSSQLADGEFRSLSELAGYLSEHPEQAVVLVGHTDAEGGLSGNIALSKKRALSVRNYLVQVLGVPTSQIDAQGVGYLSPIASNLTDGGRSENRRVEVILTSTQ